MLRTLRQIIPQRLFARAAPLYHRSLAFLGALLYGFPSKRLKVIGVTGTDGKSTTVRLIGAVLEAAGFCVAWSSSIDFKIGETTWPNELQTMPGRFFLQRFLRQAVRANSQYAILEVTSEGIAQFRHRYIEFDVAVLTNITPEHIEHHGSFEKYRRAKLKLFQHLARLRTKPSEKVSIVNLDDPNSQLFLSQSADQYWGYTLKEHPELSPALPPLTLVNPSRVELTRRGTHFVYQGEPIHVSLLGEFNLSNVLAALAVGLSQGIPLRTIKRGLENVRVIPGRLEFIESGQPFDVVVDYALTPAAFEKVYKFFSGSRLVCVFGAAGGRRDRWKRPVLGEIAARHCSYVILTSDDSYDEDPARIIEQIAQGIERARRSKSSKSSKLSKVRKPQKSLPLRSYEKVLDRREAIRRALVLAKRGDVVLITGMGPEQWMLGPKGSRIPWDDRRVAREELRNLGYTKQ